MDLYTTGSIIAIGALVAASAGLVGSFLVLRRLAMLGDAISHAVLPGIAIGYLLTSSRAPLVMVVGAAAFGLLTTYLTQTLQQVGVQEDAGMGVTFTALFAFGVFLIAAYAGQVHLDLEHVLYGEIAYAPWDQWVVAGRNLGPRALWTMGSIFLLDLVVISLFFKEFKVVSFDPDTAAALGISVPFFHYLLMALVSITTVGAFDSVGAILVVAMLVVPGATAYLLTENLATLLVLAGVHGALSSVLGYFLARLTDTSIAAAMATVAGLLFVIAFLFSPKEGLIARHLQRARLSGRLAGKE